MNLVEILKSWKNEEGNINTVDEILSWINRLNNTIRVNIRECSINSSSFWFYDKDEGQITNKNRGFFSIKGIQSFDLENCICEQPIIVQPEIGYLGIICKEIDGVLNFLMQAKIEPGNVNCVQISPTIQATKSNFTRVHGGKQPEYLEYFRNANDYTILYDQIQSEQSTRFYKKRNRNMIVLVDEEITVKSNFMWMTLGQIKRLMEIDNLVNMDTRTVLSGIPLSFIQLDNTKKDYVRSFFSDSSFYNSIYEVDPFQELTNIYHKINDYKMFKNTISKIVPLNILKNWNINEYGVTCNSQANFMVRYYNIEIEDREVQNWIQPLFKATGMATFGLLSKIENGTRFFLVKINHEIGTFDNIELGPTIQWESNHNYENDYVEQVFCSCVQNNKGILRKVILSEEGGRFFHEQNYNYIVETNADVLKEIPSNYVWVSYCTLNYLLQINNCLNIQLRNLLALIKL